MATYLEVRELWLDADLRNRTEIALGVSAQIIADGSAPTDDEIAWVNLALSQVTAGSESIKALKYVLSKYNAQPVEDIKNVTDVQLQSSVDDIVPELVRGYAIERGTVGTP